AGALAATSKFLAPGRHEYKGFKTLASTFERKCELFQDHEVKKVHALGSLGFGEWFPYAKLKELDEKGHPTGKQLANPWTGLFDPVRSPGAVPLVIRFSIANPVAYQIDVPGDQAGSSKKLSLEFIPGVAFKFLIDGQRSIDLVAMDSLAGQGSDQNFFREDFS